MAFFAASARRSGAARRSRLVPPPMAAKVGSSPGRPRLPVIAIWLAVIGVDIWILTRDHNPRVPNSPA